MVFHEKVNSHFDGRCSEVNISHEEVKRDTPDKRCNWSLSESTQWTITSGMNALSAHVVVID